MLEPCDGKLSSTVLRGERGRKAPDLLGAVKFKERMMPLTYPLILNSRRINLYQIFGVYLDTEVNNGNVTNDKFSV